MKIIFLILALTASLAHAGRITLTRTQEKVFSEKINSWWGEGVKFQSDLLNGTVISWADVTSDDKNKTQKMLAKVVGLHPRTCRTGLRKISRYEDYRQHMSFVKESTYNEAAKRVRFVLDHAVLPFPMVLSFVLPRITGPGTTDFLFPDGIFTGLKGRIHVAEVGNRCAYFLEANWEGKTTGLPNLVVSTFAQTLTKMGLEHLIRISSL